MPVLVSLLIVIQDSKQIRVCSGQPAKQPLIIVVDERYELLCAVTRSVRRFWPSTPWNIFDSIKDKIGYVAITTDQNQSPHDPHWSSLRTSSCFWVDTNLNGLFFTVRVLISLGQRVFFISVHLTSLSNTSLIVEMLPFFNRLSRAASLAASAWRKILQKVG